MKTLLVGLDRDGTINAEVPHLGRNNNWKEQTKLLTCAAQGIRELNKHPSSKIVVVTNQAGVAHGYLTLERVTQINTYIDELLRAERAHIHAWYACPHVPQHYALEHKLPPDNPWIKDNGWRKPETGMLKQAAHDLHTTLEECLVYVVGDRTTDVQLALNAGGKGILIPAISKEYQKTKELEHQNTGKIFYANNILEAAEIILADSRVRLHSHENLI